MYMKKMKIKKYLLGIILCVISLYVFPRIFRYHYNTYLSAFNILFYLGFLLFALKSDNKEKFSHNKRVFSIIIFIILSIIVFISQGWSNFAFKIKCIFSNCMPIFILSELFFSKNEKMTDFANIWYKIIRFSCFTLFFLWIIDKFANNGIQKFFLNFYKVESLYSMYYSNRFISFYGHSLVIAILMFTLLLWTLVLYDNKVRVKNYFLTLVISFIGIAITGSKSILVLATMLLITYFINKKNFKYLIPILLILTVLYKTGVFDVTLSRLSDGLKSGDISSNRNSSITELIGNGTMKFNYLRGYDIDRSPNSRMIAALEYPILRWAYNSGILFAFILTMVYFVVPIFKIFKMGNLRFCISMVIYILAVNIFDGLATSCDALLLFILNICLLTYIVNKSNILKRKEY